VARRLIGLDIGTNAVRVAEIEPGDPARVTSFGQVALPPGAMRDGEIVDEAVVTEAIQRLWKELSLKKGPVRLGVATPRVLVRTVDLPTMSDDELAGALQFQAQELIPIPLEDAVLDFQVLEALPVPEATPDGPPPQPMSRVLLAAAHRDLIGKLTGAVRAAGLTVAAVDLVPLALVRSVGRRVSDNGGGVEAIVSIGGGVTVVVVHELGVPRFVRILGSGGRNVTEAVSRDLEVSPEQAEAIKRQLDLAPEDVVTRARAAMARPISDLVEQIRGSLDYYRTQPDAIRLLRVTLTGGGSLTPGLADRLLDTVGVPVDLARPREHVAVGDIGFPDDQLPLLDPFLPVPVGLALGGSLTGKRIDLLGGKVKGGDVDRSQLIKIAAVAAAVLLVLLAGLTYLKAKQVSDEQDKVNEAQAQNAELQSQIDALSEVAERQQQIETLSAQTQALLVNDVSWSTLLQQISRTIPSDVWLTSFQGAVNSGVAGDPAATATTAPAGSLSGTVNFAAVGLDFDAVASWIQRMGTDIPAIADLWVPNASRAGAADTSSTSGSTASTDDNVTFSSTGVLTEEAKSDRAEEFQVTP
jgi:type IV pilus assembly protein PilM